MKYKPSYNKSKGWETIERRYAELINLGLKYEPMLELVRHIRNTDLKKRLFACTSMHTSIISIYEAIEPQRESIHIDFMLKTREWFFQYYSANNRKEVGFFRIYDETVGIQKLEQFVEGIRW